MQWISELSENSKFSPEWSSEREGVSFYQKSSYGDLLKRLCMLCDLGNLLSCTQQKKVLLSLRSYLVPSSSVVVCRFVPIKNNILEIRQRENVLYGRYWHMKLSTMDLCSLLLWATYRVKWRFIYKKKTKREECGAGGKCLCGRTREEIRNCFFNNI